MKVLEPQIADSERVVMADTTAVGVDAAESMSTTTSAADLHFELALFARGLESFCSAGRHAFRNDLDEFGDRENFRNEFQITLAVLLKCGELVEELGRIASRDGNTIGGDVEDFSRSIRPLIVTNTALARNESLNFAEWNGWSELVAERLACCELSEGFDVEFEECGRGFLPEQLLKCARAPEFDAADRRDLHSCLSKLGGILRALAAVREMLVNDAPLKPAVAIFAFVNEMVNELLFEISERLSLREDETSEVFAILDATAYTLAIESKKVYSYELAAVVGTRSASSVFARTEAAFSLLNDNIRHLLSGFARLTDPDTEAGAIFPEFIEKLERSIELRSELWSVMNAVRAAEAGETEEQLETLRPRLANFLRSHLGYLFYKDHETFERFCEEIMISDGGPDIRPLLHRFSAYVETLFNQVGMRVVLANHPFTPDQDH